MLKPRSGIELGKNIGLHYCIEGDVGGCHDFGFVVHAERGGARRHFDGGADHGEAGGQQLEQQRGGRREHLRGESVSNAAECWFRISYPGQVLKTDLAKL